MKCRRINKGLDKVALSYSNFKNTLVQKEMFLYGINSQSSQKLTLTSSYKSIHLQRYNHELSVKKQL